MTDLSSLVADLAALTARVQRLEDEREIVRTITTYGFTVDVGDADACAALYTDDTVIDLGPTSQFSGSDGARQLVHDPRHQAIVGRCAHTMGPLVVDVAVDGDTATATGYVRVYIADDDTSPPRLWRMSFTTFELRRTQDGSLNAWQIAKRLSRTVGAEGGAELLRVGLRGQH